MEQWPLYEDGVRGERILTDYLEHHRPEVVDVKVKPLVAMMEKAKHDYFNALFDLYEIEKEYAPIVGELKDLATRIRVNGAYCSIHPVVDFNEISRITESEVYLANQNVFDGRVFPNSIKREEF
jgi:hypothetical protein